VEGIGYDFLPTVLDRTYVDRWYKSNDKDSFSYARRLMREEAMLVGGSSGAVLYCALQAIHDFNITAGQRVVVLLPDSVRNYMTKYLSDEWMIARDFLQSDFVGDAPRPAYVHLVSLLYMVFALTKGILSLKEFHLIGLPLRPI
jgi:hypothetical protein